MSDVTDALYGEEFSKKNEAMEKEYLALDEKYPDVLDEEDSFYSHVFIHWNKGHFSIENDENKIPQHIINEMQEIFLKYFGGEKK